MPLFPVPIPNSPSKTLHQSIPNAPPGYFQPIPNTSSLYPGYFKLRPDPMLLVPVPMPYTQNIFSEELRSSDEKKE